MKELTIEQVRCLAHRLAQEKLQWDEPIPNFDTRFIGKLESCLKTPLQSFGNKSLYPRLEDKAAILFYLLIKNHPFQNGNKRIAVTSLLTFLWLNSKWLHILPEDLYQIAVWVAESRPVAKGGTIIAIHDTVQKHLVAL